MNVLVTGANGFVGRNLCALLASRGFSVHAAVRSSGGGQPGAASIDIGTMDGQTNWREVLKEVKIVVHLAARVHVMSDDVSDPLAEYRTMNVQATTNLARQAAQAGVRRLVFVSSIKVHGESTPPGQAFRETDHPSPQDAYGLSKWEAEQSLRQIACETGLEVVIIRPPLVYGPQVKANFAVLMRAVQRGWPLPLGAINNARSLVALENLADFIVLCCTHPAAANQAFLISDGQDLSTAQLVRGLAAAANVPARLLKIPPWILELAGRLTGKSQTVQRLCSNLQVDISKARNRLGWVPVVSVTEGLRRAFQGC